MLKKNEIKGYYGKYYTVINLDAVWDLILPGDLDALALKLPKNNTIDFRTQFQHYYKDCILRQQDLDWAKTMFLYIFEENRIYIEKIKNYKKQMALLTKPENWVSNTMSYSLSSGDTSSDSNTTQGGFITNKTQSKDSGVDTTIIDNNTYIGTNTGQSDNNSQYEKIEDYETQPGLVTPDSDTEEPIEKPAVSAPELEIKPGEDEDNQDNENGADHSESTNGSKESADEPAKEETVTQEVSPEPQSTSKPAIEKPSKKSKIPSDPLEISILANQLNQNRTLNITEKELILTKGTINNTDNNTTSSTSTIGISTTERKNLIIGKNSTSNKAAEILQSFQVEIPRLRSKFMSKFAPLFIL